MDRRQTCCRIILTAIVAMMKYRCLIALCRSNSETRTRAEEREANGGESRRGQRLSRALGNALSRIRESLISATKHRRVINNIARSALESSSLLICKSVRETSSSFARSLSLSLSLSLSIVKIRDEKKKKKKKRKEKKRREGKKRRRDGK